jgi:hypothetical protein
MSATRSVTPGLHQAPVRSGNVKAEFEQAA